MQSVAHHSSYLDADPSPLPVLVVGGTGRSGTTILSKILTSHPETTDVPELRFLIDPDGPLDFLAGLDGWSPYTGHRKLQRLEALLTKVGRRHPLWPLLARTHHVPALEPLRDRFAPAYWRLFMDDYCPGYKAHVKQLMSDLTAFRFPGRWAGMSGTEPSSIPYLGPQRKTATAAVSRFLLSIYGSIAKHQGKAFYLEKNTWNILWLDRILEVLPHARLVHIHRDPRDITCSYATMNWMPNDPVQCAIICRDVLDRWAEVRARCDSESYLEISLESLVEEPEKILKVLCEFYGLPWSNALLAHDLSKSHQGRWKRDLPGETARAVNDILAEHIQAYGYEQ